MMTRSLREQRGFTLIEVLISMAIIAVGMIALVTLFPVGLRSSRLAGDFTTASFIGQQALDSIRATAQVYDPGDGGFDSANGNGLGYYELPVSRTKGALTNIRFPRQPEMSQWWDIVLTGLNTYDVISSIYGAQTNSGTVGGVYRSDNNDISFILVDNVDGPDLPAVTPAFNDTNGRDKDYDEFQDGDEIVLHIEMRGGAPYFWHAMRAPVTEDIDLDGILDGRLPGGSLRSAPHATVQEDIGLDLVPDYWDRNNNGSYEENLDHIGETGFDGDNDPHGDNFVSSDPNSAGTEGNGRIDAWADEFMQKVTVTVGWREGGQDRAATFSAAIPNQFR